MKVSVKAAVVGYPYIGENREWKKIVERFWKQELSEQELQLEFANLRKASIKKQEALGLTQITVGDFTYYDRMLDLAFLFNMIPERYQHIEGAKTLTTYYAMARGNDDTVASEMTKWFNTNYHYIVPEYNDAKLQLNHNIYVDWLNEAKEVTGTELKATIIGPYTFAKLTKGYDEKQLASFMIQLVPLYSTLIQQLAEAGASSVQIEEPALTLELTEEDIRLVEEIYKQLDEATTANIILTTYFEALSNYERLIKLPVAGFGLDFVHGKKGNIQAIRHYGFPQDKVLVIGLINGRDIWRTNLMEQAQFVQAIQYYIPNNEIWIQSSCSLQHCPVTTKVEVTLQPVLKNALAFSDEKIPEIVQIAEYIETDVWPNPSAVSASMKAIEALQTDVSRNNAEVANELKQLTNQDFHRPLAFEERLALQQQALNLPLFPTTTIGSFPQSREVKAWRAAWRKGNLSDEAYEEKLNEETTRWIHIQEQLGLDVLVHGEFERTDMVEYFGEKLEGFAFTKNAWVVSYGSRCVKPPIIFGDVDWTAPMTVKEAVFAQSKTSKYVKGMLTGPVTILNWSFVRDDISRAEVANQIALALRKEVAALEDAGIRIIQVDEPALREGLPLRKENWADYLQWAVKAFKLSTSNVDNETQIHTHMCYCEFNDFIEPITALNADVISLETSRSHGELIHSLQDDSYPYGVGLGVYDIHSPRVPEIVEMTDILNDSLAVIPAPLFWVNPDCGLKTRQEPETIAALKNMVAAAKVLREKLDVKQ